MTGDFHERSSVLIAPVPLSGKENRPMPALKLFPKQSDPRKELNSPFVKVMFSKRAHAQFLEIPEGYFGTGSKNIRNLIASARIASGTQGRSKHVKERFTIG